MGEAHEIYRVSCLGCPSAKGRKDGRLSWKKAWAVSGAGEPVTCCACTADTRESRRCLRRNPRLFLESLGCFVSGLYLEGADWDVERGCLIKSKPKVLVVDLPILKIIPIEAHRLKLQVGGVTLGVVQTFWPFITRVVKLWWVGEAPRQGTSVEPLPGKTHVCTGV